MHNDIYFEMAKNEVSPNHGSLIDRLKKVAPNKDVLFTAISQLESPPEIRQFRNEYEEHLRTHGKSKEVRLNAAEVANDNIGYALGYYDEKTSTRWLSILEEVSHPLFGRKIPYNNPGPAYELGKLGVKKIKVIRNSAIPSD